jgi:hypothetical protein
MVAPEFRGRGLASRALMALMAGGTRELGLLCFNLACHADNIASQRVARNAASLSSARGKGLVSAKSPFGAVMGSSAFTARLGIEVAPRTAVDQDRSSGRKERGTSEQRVGCANSVFPANKPFSTVRPNLRTPQAAHDRVRITCSAPLLGAAGRSTLSSRTPACTGSASYGEQLRPAGYRRDDE